ncbi:coiled-coil domain-containing protein 12 isoform X1 [Nomascus leucogenys]|uniref:coiled-coil domain-containing protein 12 isoform X1 n=1 Tax=Nomascus leucogenys TaxID=61853 RepID=UPI00122D6F26|nr:coiled-coil domain-containing protein 12 isoform X1 [Nomascus leucogenys]
MGRAAREGAPPPCPTSAIGKANLSLRDEGRGLRDAGREKRRGVGGQDGGDYGWCGPARGRGVAAKGTAEGPTGENRAQGQGRWGAKDQASQRRGGRRREAQGLRERTHVEKKIGSAAVPEMKGPRQMEQGQALEAIPRELRLRNYVPEDEDLKKRRVPQAKPVAVEEKVKEQLEAAKPEPVIEEVVSAWATLASSLLLCVLFLFTTCFPSAPHSFSSLLYSLPSCLFALVPLLPPSLSPISLLLEPALPLVLGRPLHPEVCLLPSQDLANLAPRKPDW